MTAPTLYKVLHPDRFAFHGGLGTWPAPGEWIEVAGPLVPCQNGLHLCRERDLVRWLGPAIWTAEYDGEIAEYADKIVVRRARLVQRLETWDERTARLFAADCGERVLPIFERDHPTDSRPREAIAAARAYAHREIDETAWAAARAAARYAAVAAARDAAWAAARAAARYAAVAAARDAAWAAAWAAARAAAWAAARAAAWAAARDAARDAARAAAMDAAVAAETRWQTARLMQYLRGEVS